MAIDVAGGAGNVTVHPKLSVTVKAYGPAGKAVNTIGDPQQPEAVSVNPVVVLVAVALKLPDPPVRRTESVPVFVPKHVCAVVTGVATRLICPTLATVVGAVADTLQPLVMSVMVTIYDPGAKPSISAKYCPVVLPITLTGVTTDGPVAVTEKSSLGSPVKLI